MSRHFSDSSRGDNGRRWDYGGLEVDTRAADNTDKHLDPDRVPKLRRPDEDNDIYLYEKEIRVEERERGQDSPSTIESPMEGGTMGGTTMVPETPCTPGKPCIHRSESSIGNPHFCNSDVKTKSIADGAPVSPPQPKPRKICGMRRRNFWILFAVVLGIIVAAAIVGGAVAGTRKNPTATSTPSTAPEAPVAATPTPSAPTVNTPLLSADVIADSPLNVISYTNPGGPDPAGKQTFRLYFQSVIGNIKETISDAFGPWQSAGPLFTDAVNNTGLATVTWLNLTDGEQSASIYYIDEKFNLQEKRKKFSDTEDWEQGTLNPILRLTTRGNVTTPDNDDNDPVNDWDGYRVAAVYSPKFVGGPQARLFYRSQAINGSNAVQELIWNQANDTWSKAFTFTDSWPTSHFAASIDESTNILRLFFSTGGKTLQEYWTDITTPDTNYQKGITRKNYLPHNNVDISTVSLNGTTYLYHYSVSAKAIREMQITGVPGDVNDQESFNSTESIVVAPAMTSTSGKATYQPLVAAKTDVVGLDPSLLIFWADTLAGLNSTMKTEGGYTKINQIQKGRDDDGWPVKPAILQVPLGDDNSEPWHPES